MSTPTSSPGGHDENDPFLRSQDEIEHKDPAPAVFKYRGSRTGTIATTLSKLWEKRYRPLHLAIAISLAAVLLFLLISILVLLVQLTHATKAPARIPTPKHLRTTDCGASAAEAKAKGCYWDELSKAWLPAGCPDYGLEQYKLEGMLANPHQNATSWAYYWDQQGTSGLNINTVAADETWEPRTPIWTTSRQHLTHCAFTLKRVVWSYKNGHGQYDAISRMKHVDHCIDTLLRGAIRGEQEAVDSITTLTRIHFGSCSSYEQ